MSSSDWLIPIMVVAVIAAFLFFRDRPRSDRRRTSPPSVSGPDVVAQIERTLGMGVIVGSIDETGPVTIQATLMLDTRTRSVVAGGATVADAWQELAQLAMAWRNEDQQQVRNWGGGL